VLGFFEQNILEDGIKKNCFFQRLENQRGFLQVGGKNKIKKISEKNLFSQFPAIVHFCW
jgi:hypothetical protein